jgi:hypothetical protein
LHVVDGVFVPDISIKAKNHAVQALPGLSRGSTR